MYKIKQLIVGIFISSIFFGTSATAENVTFHGTVTLPTSITDLLSTCTGADCPSLNVDAYRRSNLINQSTFGGFVDYNATSGLYEYTLNIDSNASDGTNDYYFYIYIQNGNMGNEVLTYSFGTDHSVGTTGDATTADVLIHNDEWNIAREYLSVALTTSDVTINFDLLNKDVGRQKIVGTVKLPAGVSLGNTSTGFNSVDVSIQTSDYNAQAYLNIFEGNGTIPFITSIKNELNVDLNLSLNLNFHIDNHPANSNLQIGLDALDVYDHSIDGDEKLVTQWLDPLTNYATFSASNDINFGVLDIDAYLTGAQLLTGTLTQPDSFPIYSDQTGYNDISLTLTSSNGADFWFNADVYFSAYNTDTSTSTHTYEILIPQDVQSKVQENNVSLNVELYSESGSVPVPYTFGTDQAVSADDHIIQSTCVDPTTIYPLSVNFAATLPVVDINLSSYIPPVTTEVSVTLNNVPDSVSYIYLQPTRVSCASNPSVTGSGSEIYNADGTRTIITTGLIEGEEYGFEVHYETGSWELGNVQFYYNILDDDDGDFTNGGSFLSSDYISDPVTGLLVFNQTYIATGTNVVFSPFDIILPVKISPALILYLLN